tara:strand:- start:3 stop:254 length:252 start_codon:yes stop_codon:yes gene_type:complete
MEVCPIIIILFEVEDGVIDADKVFDPVTYEVDVVVLCVLSDADTTCKIFPNPVAVPELAMVAPEGIVIVSPEAPIVKDVPVLG